MKFVISTIHLLYYIISYSINKFTNTIYSSLNEYTQPQSSKILQARKLHCPPYFYHLLRHYLSPILKAWNYLRERNFVEPANSSLETAWPYIHIYTHIRSSFWKGWKKGYGTGWKDFLAGIQIALLRELIPVRGAGTKSKSLLISLQAEYTFRELWKYFHQGGEQQCALAMLEDLSRGREVESWQRRRLPDFFPKAVNVADRILVCFHFSLTYASSFREILSIVCMYALRMQISAGFLCGSMDLCSWILRSLWKIR